MDATEKKAHALQYLIIEHLSVSFREYLDYDSARLAANYLGGSIADAIVDDLNELADPKLEEALNKLAGV